MLGRFQNNLILLHGLLRNIQILNVIAFCWVEFELLQSQRQM